MTTITSPTPIVTHDTDADTELGEPKVAHIVRKEDQMKGYIEGAPIEALCGKIWVPSRDPNNYPVCEACKAEMEKIIAAQKGVN